jgi:hypothetical protein
MRLDINNLTERQLADLHFTETEVFLDGFAQTYVIVADEEQGYIEKYYKNPQGEFYLDGDNLAIARISGKVKIKSKEE